MPDVTLDTAVDQIRAILQEAFEGPQQPWSYFTDQGADAALLGTLEKLSAAEASRVVGGTSVAAHVHHVAFGLSASAGWIKGDRTQRNWQESWLISTIDDNAWPVLLDVLRNRYAELKEAIDTHALTSIEALGGAMGAVAHVAYHLGAIRQKIACAAELPPKS